MQSSSSPSPAARDLVLAGGGHTHALVLRMLAMKPLPGVRVTLVSDATDAPYSGMVPGLIAGFYTWREAHIDLRRLAEAAGATFVRAAACGVDPAARQLLLTDRPPLRYDVLSLNTGSTPDLSAVPGAAAFAIPAKPVPVLLAGWERIVSAVAAGAQPHLIIAGGGAGGVELALTMHRKLEGRARVTVVHRGHQILDGHNDRVREKILTILTARGVTVLTDSAVEEVTAGSVRISRGGKAETLRADFTLWVTGAAPHAWIRASGLPVDAHGFLTVGPTLEVPGFPGLFGAGDVAALADPRPKSGVFAVRAAKPLMENLTRFFAGRPLAPWHPQRQFLSLIGTGDGSAVASRKGLAWHSPLMWRWKDRIDRKFMEKFSGLPAIAAEPAADPPDPDKPLPAVLADLQRRSRMRCLGCAAKVGSSVLSTVMARLRADFPDVLDPGEGGTGLDAPDDAAVFTAPPGGRVVQTVDYMPALVSDPFLFGRIAALHCFSDIFAMGAEPHSVLAAVLLPFSEEKLGAEILYQLLAGVLTELRPMSARLLGGHTAEGAVTALALTCNGFLTDRPPLRKAGLAPGQALILTKAAGTGTLFAASMRLAAEGRWLDAAIASMLISNLGGARILARHGVTACTDVTGFGLAGHLGEMVNASGTGATLTLDALPALPGALQCLQRGIVSSLQAANQRAMSLLANAAAFTGNPRLALLFDPQTSGGLLAGVPASNAAACLAELRRSGCPDAAIIGEVTPDPGDGAPLRLT